MRGLASANEPGRRVRDAAGAPAWWRSLAWPAWSLVLRPVRREDARAVSRAVTDEIARWVGFEGVEAMRAATPPWAARAEELARRRDGYTYVVEREGRLSGVIEVRRDPVRGHVGYWLRRPERGRGTMTMALEVVLRVGFEGMRLRAVDLTADADNRASIAVMERVGARLEGVFPSSHAAGGFEARYRIARAAFRPSPTGPRRLADLLTSV